MSRLSPVKRKDLISKLKIFGFEGPYSGGKHEFMIKGTIRLTLPNLHKSDIGAELLSKILKQSKIDKDEWLKL
jgi:predicted RNA binding protein YcfA (HicA-like mRNA interferase family)